MTVVLEPNGNSVELLGIKINPDLVDIPSLKFVIDRRFRSNNSDFSYKDHTDYNDHHSDHHSCGALPWP